MNKQEFSDVWRPDFAARFPSINEWVERQADAAAVLRSWYETALESLSIQDALDATRELQEGLHDMGGWQDFPRDVVAAANAIAYQRKLSETKRHEPSFTEYRVNCPICRDAGLVTCWSVETMLEARQHILNGTPIRRWYTCGVACTCDRGAIYGSWATKRGREMVTEERPRYDPDRWVRLTLDTDADRQALLEWATNYRPPNYCDFGEYGGEVNDGDETRHPRSIRSCVRL